MGGRFSRQSKAPAAAPGAAAVRLVLTPAEDGAAVHVEILPAAAPPPPVKRLTPCPSVPEEHQVVRVQLQASGRRVPRVGGSCLLWKNAPACATCRRLSMPLLPVTPPCTPASLPPWQESFSPNKAVHLVLLTTDKAAQVRGRGGT